VYCAIQDARERERTTTFLEKRRLGWREAKTGTGTEKWGADNGGEREAREMEYRNIDENI